MQGGKGDVKVPHEDNGGVVVGKEGKEGIQFFQKCSEWSRRAVKSDDGDISWV